MVCSGVNTVFSGVHAVFKWCSVGVHAVCIRCACGVHAVLGTVYECVDRCAAVPVMVYNCASTTP